MKSPASRFSLFGAASLCALVAFSTCARAAEKSPTPSAAASRETLLKIVNGKIANVTKDGQPVPATLSAIVDKLREEYGDASITLVGVDNVLIENVTLRLAPRNSALRSALTALAEASGRKFRVQDFSDKDVVLTADRSPVGNRIVEVFNLGPLLSNNRAKQLERELRDAETNLIAVRKVMGNDHGRVADINTQIEILKSHLAQAAPPPNGAKVIDQIKETVSITLQLLKSAEHQPEFQYHPGMNLLIVVGGDDAIEVTRKVVTALEKGAN